MSGGDHSRGWGPAAEGLRLLFWAMLLSGAAWALGSLAHGLMRHGLMSFEGHALDSGWVHWLGALSVGQTALDLGLSIVIVLASVQLVRLPTEVGAGNWLSMALLAAGLMAVMDLLSLTFNLFQGFGIQWGLLHGFLRWSHWVQIGVRLAFTGGLLMGLHRMALRLNRSLDPTMLSMLVGAVVLASAYPLLRYAIAPLRDFFHTQVWMDMGILFALLAAWTVSWCMLIADVHGAVAAKLKGESARGVDLSLSHQWKTAGSGLKHYRLALLWKIWILVGSLVFGVIGGLSRSESLIQFVLVVGALVGLGTSAWMLWGLFRYLGLPSQSRARPAGFVALGFGVLALLGDGVSMGLLSMGLGGGGWGGLQGMMVDSQIVNGAVQASGLLGLLALLFSFLQAARALRHERAIARCMALFKLVPATFVAAIGVRVLLASGELRSAVGAIVLGLGVLGLAIVTLVVYIKLVGWLAKAAEERGEQQLESAFD